MPKLGPSCTHEKIRRNNPVPDKSHISVDIVLFFQSQTRVYYLGQTRVYYVGQTRVYYVGQILAQP